VVRSSVVVVQPDESFRRRLSNATCSELSPERVSAFPSSGESSEQAA
jgi:hypothetical protein